VAGIPLYEILAANAVFLVLTGVQLFAAQMAGRLTMKLMGLILFDHLLMLVLLAPFWWLHVRVIRHWSWSRKIALLLVTGPLYGFCYLLLANPIYRFVIPRPGVKAASFDDPNRLLFQLNSNGAIFLLAMITIYLYHLFLARKAQAEREKELLSLAFSSELNALKSQIQPHFLFNTLNSISASVPPEQEETRKLIAKLADTFRYSLQATQQDWVPLREELHFLRTLLELEQVRFGERLSFTIDASPEAEDVLVPSMLLQPILENAVRHGIAPMVDGGQISLRFTVEAGRLKVFMADTGAGYRGELQHLLQTSGVGLRNTNLRLKHLYNESLHIDQNQPSGLIFTFSVPAAHHA
jgi:hypothetical protein